MTASRIDKDESGSPIGSRRSVRIILLITLSALLLATIYFTSRSRHAREEGVSLLVLPFSTPTDLADKDYLALGMSATLALQLGELPDLDVDSPTLWSVLDPDSSSQRLAARLGVDEILRGEIDAGAGEIDVRMQLDSPDRAGSGETLGISGSVDSLIDLQMNLLITVARHLGIEMQATDLERARRSLARSSKAFQDYLRGIAYLADIAQPRSPRFAAELLSRAVQLDPRFALARVELGRARWRQGIAASSTTTDEYRQALQAIEIANRRVRGLRSAATIRILAQHTLHPSLTCAEAAEKWGLRSVRASRQLQDLAASYLQVGSLQAAEDCLRATVDLVPEGWRTWSRWGSFLWKTGRLEEARNAYAQAYQLAPPAGLGPPQILSLLSLQMGDLSTALEIFESTGEDPVDAEMAHDLALASSASGDLQGAETLARMALSFATQRPRYHETLGDVLAQAGRSAEAEVEYRLAFDSVARDRTSRDDGIGGELQHLLLAAKAGHCDFALPAATTRQRHSIPRPESSYRLARIFAVCGQRDLALESLVTAIELGFPREEIVFDRLFERAGLENDIQVLLEGANPDSETD